MVRCNTDADPAHAFEAGSHRIQVRHPGIHRHRWWVALISLSETRPDAADSGWVVLSGRTHVKDPYANFRNAFEGSSHSSFSVRSPRGALRPLVEHPD